MKYNRYLLTTILLLLFQISLTGQNIIRGPYLQLNTPSGIILRWRTDMATQSKVWYGAHPDNLTLTKSLTGTRTEHEVQLTGLPSNAKYYYAVGNEAGQIAGADGDHFFTTSPIPGTVQPVSIWVLGDAGKNKEGNVEQREVRDAFYAYNGGPHVDLILALGDNACEDGLDWEFQTAWFEDMYEASIINSPTWSTIGNHEVNSADSEQETGAYYEIFNFPRNGEAGGVPSGTEAYYSFDYANIHFICINTEDVDQSPDGEMYAWLQADLAANDREWLIAFFHRQPYYDSAPMRSIFLPLLESAGLDLAMFGHKHAYQRSPLINGHYDGITYYDESTMAIDAGDGRVDGDGAYLKPLGLAPNAGAVYMQSGSAGSGGSPNDYPVMPYMVSGDPEGVGSVHIAVNGPQLEATYISKDGHVYDHFSIYKQTGSAPMVSITSPADGARYETIQPITITADASDPDGQVGEVEFFVNDVSIGIDALAPYRVSWTPPAEDFYAVHAVVRDDEDNERASSTIRIRVGTPPAGTLEVAVSSGNDDAEEDLNTGQVSLTSSDLELGYELLTPQLAGIRFDEVDLQRGSRITKAYIQFYLDEVSSGTSELTITGQDADNAAAFLKEDFNLSSRPQTSASANWNPPSWDEGETNDPDQRTVDISAIVEEIAARPGWRPNNAMVFLISGLGTRTAESYEGSFAGAPVLHIEYDNTVVPCPEAGDPCDDGDDCTENDVVDANCDCVGTLIDTDGDGVGGPCVGNWTLHLMVYLQGAYDAGTGSMRDDLRASNLLPLEEPYTSLGYTQVGGGGEHAQPTVFDVEGANAIVDWLFLELRDRADPAIVRATRSVLLQTDGDVVDIDGVSPVEFINLPVDEYYVVVKHRNHAGVMSALPCAMSDEPTTIDFTSNPEAIYGGVNGIGRLTDGKMGLISGDFNHNDQVQNTDYNNVILTLGVAGYHAGDFDLNGQVQNTDLQLQLLPNIGRGAACP
jgi:hypothetical protein